MKYISKEDFFSFYCQRLANLKQIEGLHPEIMIHPYASFNPEFNILLAALLDSLAKYWDLTVLGGLDKQHGMRFGTFLVTHADPNIWGRCSRLALLRSSPKGLCDDKKTILRAEVEKTYPSKHPDPAEVFGWQDDPEYSELAANAELKKVDCDRWLRKSRYGEILYSHYRCGWLHALNPDSAILTESAHGDEPHYCSHNSQRAFVIPTKFVVRTLKEAICSFQEKAPDRIRLEA